MSRALALREHDDTPNTDSIIVLHDVTWEDYERLLEIRGDKSAPRINYLEGELEIMSPSKDHEQIKSFIGRLLEAWCMDRGIEVTPFGSWTLKERKQDRGAEADECYIFGTAPRERPQLVIEVEWTRRSIDKLRIYEKLGVDEVWTWRKGVIQVYVLVGEKSRKQNAAVSFPTSTSDSSPQCSTATRSLRPCAILEKRSIRNRESGNLVPRLAVLRG
jgi:Uma2 family endonuclease